VRHTTVEMDYALPRTDALPSFVTELSEVPSTSNLLGLRGGGEGTPERVWRAIHGAA